MDSDDDSIVILEETMPNRPRHRNWSNPQTATGGGSFDTIDLTSDDDRKVAARQLSTIEIDLDGEEPADESKVLTPPVRHLAFTSRLKKKRRREEGEATNWKDFYLDVEGSEGEIQILEVDDAKPSAKAGEMPMHMATAKVEEIAIEEMPMAIPFAASAVRRNNTIRSDSKAFRVAAAAVKRPRQNSHRQQIQEISDTDTVKPTPISTAVKLSPRQSAMQQIQEIFPDMLPSHISEHLDKIETINSKNVQWLIQSFLADKSYPKIEKKPPKVEEKKEVDYANDEFEQTIQYKYQANDRLLNTFPFMSKQGIQRLLQKFNGRYHKTYMHIVNQMKKLKNFANEVEMHEEFLRLMSGGKLTSECRSKFALELNGIKYETTLKASRKNRGSIMVTDAVLSDEIAFTKKIMRAWGKAVQMERNRLVARKKAEESGATVECTCCYGDYAMMEMVTCNEGHIFCMDCLRRYAEEKVFGNGDLGKEGSTELCCMDMSGCQSFFSRDQLSKSLSEKVMKKYDELQTTLVLEKAGLKDICKCPICDFQASLPESEQVLNCPSCGFDSCRKCGEEAHIPLRCEEVEKKTETSARLQIEEAMTQARIRYCPKGCKQGFYKVEGCNKMTCPTCKSYICYVCRKEIPKSLGYAHFCQTPHCAHTSCNGCPLYTNAEEDDARASREAGLKTAKELKGDVRTQNVAEKMENILQSEEQQTTQTNHKHARRRGGNAAVLPPRGIRRVNALNPNFQVDMQYTAMEHRQQERADDMDQMHLFFQGIERHQRLQEVIDRAGAVRPPRRNRRR